MKCRTRSDKDSGLGDSSASNGMIRKFSPLILSLVGLGLWVVPLGSRGLYAAQEPKSLITQHESPFKAPADFAAAVGDYRKKWSRITGINTSALHWNQSIMVFSNNYADIYQHNYDTYIKQFNDDYDDESEIQFKTYPKGAIFLKEHFFITTDQPVVPITITLMIKEEKGYSPDYGDWRFVQYGVNGNIIINGKGSDPVINQLCGECHKNIAERDYIFHTFNDMVKR